MKKHKHKQQTDRIDLTVERITDDDPQAHMLLAQLMSTTMQIFNEEKHGNADLDRYQKTFDRMFDDAPEHDIYIDITAEIYQQIIIRHFNDTSKKYQMAVSLDIPYMKEKLREYAEEKQQRGRGRAGVAANAEHARTLPKP